MPTLHRVNWMVSTAEDKADAYAECLNNEHEDKDIMNGILRIQYFPRL